MILWDAGQFPLRIIPAQVKQNNGSPPRRRRVAIAAEELAVAPYFFSIGGAIFSAGAGGRAGLAAPAAPCVCGSGRAGSGAGVVGRSPPGLASAGLF
ncbi:hypothetical protein XH83_04820 [Bradyrhizobium sp. CCBAU 53351]|nr:hypothetical protein XH83_04820 [Bradyrhizobium sp. CCBAU 53351]